MKPMKFTRIMVMAAASLGLLAAPFAASAQGDREPAASLDELLQRVQADSAEANQAASQRLAEFRQARDRQQALLGQAQAELNQLQGQANGLQAQFDANQVRIDELDAELSTAQGEFGELFGVARQTAGEFAASIRDSAVSAQYPGRDAVLERLANSTTLPTREELDALWKGMLREMIEQGRSVYFERPVANMEGEAATVYRAGPFVLFAGANDPLFLNYSGGTNTLAVLEAQPPGRIVAAAERVADAEPGEIVKGPVDPSRGQLLAIQKDVPTLRERIDAGGIIGRIILIVFAIGLILGIIRLVMLMMTSFAVRSQASNPETPKKGNPLGRVLMVYEEHKAEPIETLELKLDEQILRENSRLEMGLSFLKLIAAVAPLMGLLGTVTGMIRTFQAITLFGTGDPQIMADGISEALVTTVLGLVTAIPILLIHSFCASAARSSQQTLDEQAAGLVAARAERRAVG